MHAALPPFPAVPDARLDAYETAHGALAAELADADPTTVALFRYVHQRLLNEAAATVAPVHRAGRGTAVVPPRRRFLPPPMARRVATCWDALRHVDERLAMRRRLPDRALIGHETPYVLNALADRHLDLDRAGDVGQVRTGRVDFQHGPGTWENPPAALCRELLAEAILAANEVPAPAVVRAGWLASVMFAVHPFVDGNGRVARLLYQLVVSDELDERWDWGTIESWAAERLAYIAAIRQTLVGSGFVDGSFVTEPFVGYALERSLTGAHTCRARLTSFAAAVEELQHELDDPEILVFLAVCADGNARRDELQRLPMTPSDVRDALGRLWAAEMLAYDPTFGWNPVRGNPLRRIPMLD